MKTITGDNLTQRTVEELVNVAAVATGQLSELFGDVALNAITPSAAAVRIHDILRPLQLVPIPVRFFALGSMVWRAIDGRIELRAPGGKLWSPSGTFHSVEDLETCLDVAEVSESALPEPIRLFAP